MAVDTDHVSTQFIQRQTLCMAGSTPGVATHSGEDDFAQRLSKYYVATESNLAEQLIHLKAELRTLDTETFWTRLMTGMTELCHAQYAFVSKRILVDDQTTAVEMPPIGEVGSCLMAVALYYNDNESCRAMNRDYKYFAWSAPCAYMKHDKVFSIPEHLNTFITNCPNSFPFEPEAYLGVPLFADGKCYAHFGMMWTKEGLKRKEGLSWTMMEMFMHSLEDMINERLLAGQGFAKTSGADAVESMSVIPQAAITATQSLKPYARSLSHELRTPMQGVVGMLDVMYATVQEQIEGQSSNKLRDIFRNLKESIEVVQDSSKRAVEAADNVVQAYDLNMQIPDTPSASLESPATGAAPSYFDARPGMGGGSQVVHTLKRKREADISWSFATATKQPALESTTERRTPEQLQSPLLDAIAAAHASPRRKSPPLFSLNGNSTPLSMSQAVIATPTDTETVVSTPSFRLSSIRELLPIVINDCLRVGGRPDFAVTEPVELGERIEVKTRSSNGHCSSKIVEWTVEAEVPYMLPIDERDLSKLISAVFLNAFKFTDNGHISVRAGLSENKRYVTINVADQGIGIPEGFQPELFKAFSKEEQSLTRSKEGLGLGLLVAKGLARRIGGDLELIRSETEGPSHGSEFQIRFPLEVCEISSRAATPMRGDVSVSRSSTIPAPNGRLHPTSPLQNQAVLAQTPDTIEPETISEVLPPVLDQPILGQPVNGTTTRNTIYHRRVSSTPRTPGPKREGHDRHLAEKFPLTFMVAEDNKINRKLLVNMLGKLGYKNVHEAYDGREAVRVMTRLTEEKLAKDSSRRRSSFNASRPIVDVILMDLWMPEMDGYQATEEIFGMFNNGENIVQPPTVLAVSADVTDGAIDRATKVGMTGYMSKPYKLIDLQKLILEVCAKNKA